MCLRIVLPYCRSLYLCKSVNLAHSLLNLYSFWMLMLLNEWVLDVRFLYGEQEGVVKRLATKGQFIAERLVCRKLLTCGYLR